MEHHYTSSSLYQHTHTSLVTAEPEPFQGASALKYLFMNVMLGDDFSDTLALAPGWCVGIVVSGISPMDARGLVPGESGRGFLLRPGMNSAALSTANS